MDITITTTGRTALQSTHKDVSMSWITTRLWMKIGQPDRARTFDALNEYWATLPEDTQEKYFKLYTEAFLDIEEGLPFIQLKTRLTNIVKRIIDLVDYPNLSAWTIAHGGIVYDKDIHDSYDGEYPKRQTYLKSEYNELAVLSMVFKMLAPIWCGFLYDSKALDKNYKELHALDLMTTSNISTIPAYERLVDYCTAITEKNHSMLTSAICIHMGTNEIPKYMLAMAIVRCIAVCDIRDPEKTLIKVVYKFLESRARNLGFGVRDKRGNRPEGDDDEDSVAEKYRISQTVPDYAVVTMANYVMDTARIVHDLNPKGSIKKAENYIRSATNNTNFTIAGYHIPFIGLVCDRVVHTRTCRLMEREPLLNLIGITAAWLSDKGYQLLANMLLSPRGSKSNNFDTNYAIGGFSFVTYTKESRLTLDELYPKLKSDTRGGIKGVPGMVMIDAIIEEINSYTWEDSGNISHNIRNEVVELLVLREKENSIKK